MGIYPIRPGWQSSAKYGLVNIGVLMQVFSIIWKLLYNRAWLVRLDARFFYYADFVVQILLCTPLCRFSCKLLCVYYYVDFILQISSSRLCHLFYCMDFSMQILLCKFYSHMLIFIVWILCSIMHSIVYKLLCVLL